MATVGGLAFALLLAIAVGGPVVVLIFGHRIFNGLTIALFVSATVSLPLAAISEPADFRGTALIMSVLIFVFGLVAMNIAGAIRAPRRLR